MWTAIINGLLAPLLLVAILIVAADRELMRGQPRSRLGWTLVAITTLAKFAAGGVCRVGSRGLARFVEYNKSPDVCWCSKIIRSPQMALPNTRNGTNRTFRIQYGVIFEIWCAGPDCLALVMFTCGPYRDRRSLDMDCPWCCPSPREVVINSEHPQFSLIEAGTPEPVGWDARLFR